MRYRRSWSWLVAMCAGIGALSSCAAAQRPSGNGTAPAAAKPSAARVALRKSVDSVFALPRFRTATWGVLVIDPETHDTLFAHNAEKLFVPASNQKVLTAAAALATLGADYRFTTRIATTGMVRDSIINGDLVVIGSGDPSFSDRMRGDAMIPMFEMADSLRMRGITRVNGRLRRGPPLFTDSPIGFGWAWDDLRESYGATVGELMYNDAFAAVRVRIEGVPDTTRVMPGEMRPRHFLDAFDTALLRRGINVFLSNEWTGFVPDSALTTLFTYSSPPLAEIVGHFLRSSQNQIGEILLKTMGREKIGAARADSGAAVVGRLLLQWGADSGDFAIRDGSGLSRNDMTSAATIARALVAMRSDTVFRNALPSAGVDGTLERRFRGTAAVMNVRAKTGSMERVRSLSGYATTADGKQLVFSILVNGITVPAAEAEAAIDAIVLRLVKLRLQG